MRYRLLGQTGLRVSELFLGTLAFGIPEDGVLIDEGRRILDVYADAGGNVIDTSSSYGGGESEAILGELLQGRRDRFSVMTKYTWTRDGEDPNAAGSHRKNLTLSLERSLRQLRTDYIDVYWVQVWDRHTPMGETMRALDDAIRAGKVLYIGISDAPAWVVARANTLAEWHSWTPFAAIQVPYSLLNRDIERELLPMAETLGLTVATWGPLGHGVLSGKYTRPGGSEPDTQEAAESLSERERSVAHAVQAVADELGATPAQVAIAWIRSRSDAIHPLLGPCAVEELKDNLGVLDLALPDDAARRLEAATEFTVGFPGDFIAEATPWVFGDVSAKVDGR